MTSAASFVPSATAPYMDSPDKALLGQEQAASRVGAAAIGITDATPLFTGSTVQAALAELGAAVGSQVGINQTETILVAGALAVDKYLSVIDGASGSYAVTLAAPPANSLGRRKAIRKTGINSITLALTNVVGMIDALGAPVSTTATFSTAEQSLTLESNGTKWVVIGSSAVGT